MSGLDVSRELLAVRADVPIILTSGYINHDVEEAARRLGVQRVLYKANTVQEFCESVRAVLRSRSES
jgi:DNA-binding NarL/FixJ family response regulator